MPSVHGLDELTERTVLFSRGLHAGVPVFFKFSGSSSGCSCNRGLPEQNEARVELSRHELVYHGRLLSGNRAFDKQRLLKPHR